MKVLIVGAGAVGQAYGYHLQRGGAEVAFFVRERYRAELSGGVVVYPLNRKDPWTPVGFADFGLHSEWTTVAAETWDQVWLAVPSTGIRTGWLPDMMAAIGDAVVVALQPGLDDRALLPGAAPRTCQAIRETPYCRATRPISRPTRRFCRWLTSYRGGTLSPRPS